MIAGPVRCSNLTSQCPSHNCAQSKSDSFIDGAPTAFFCCRRIWCLSSRELLTVSAFNRSLAERAGVGSDATALCAPPPSPSFSALKRIRVHYIAYFLWERLCRQYAEAHHAYPSDRLPSRQSLGLAAIRTFSHQYFRGVLDSDVHWADVGVFRVFDDSRARGP